MKYFGRLKPKLIENFNGKKIANFLIKNELYEHAIKKQYYFTDDFSDDFIDERESSYNYLNDIEHNNLTIKSSKVFFLILFEFMKSVSAQLNEQLKKDLNQYMNIGEKSKINLNDLLINEGEYIKLEPSQILIDDFYESVVNRFSCKIIDEKCMFFQQYNEEVFGLNFNEQKRITLKHYKEIFKSLFEDNITYLPDDTYNSEDENISFEIDFLKIENKLKMVFYNRIKYQHILATINPFYEYLTGNKSIFKEGFYKKNQTIIDQVLIYEARKEIMVELNKKYEFEDDFYSTNQNDEEKSIEDFIPSINEIKLVNSKNNSTPFIDLLRHENKIEIERIIKTHYSDLKGVSLRYLIEFLIDNQILLINYGDKTKIQKSLKMLFNNNDIGTVSSIFDIKIDRLKDRKYLNAKDNFLKTFEKII
ncbi:MAG: hypothetical protein H7Z76_04260 [Methylotenera sp.]|nr:hypothetical protein [Flavobacterium sp.]